MKYTDLRNLLIVSVAILLGMALAACGGGKYHGELLRAESILDSLPDSAREILKNIPRNTIDTREDLALRDLLQAEVDYKLYQDDANDSLISLAISEFQRNNDRNRLMRALFQRVQKKYYRADYKSAMMDALTALDIAEESRDTFYLAKINDQIADIYNYNYNFLKLANTSEKPYYILVGKKRTSLFMLVDIARNLCNIGQIEESLALTDSVLSQADSGDFKLTAYAYECRIRPFLRLENLGKAIESVDSSLKYNKSGALQNKTIPVLLAIKSGNLLEAKTAIDKAINDTLSDLSIEDFNYINYMYNMASGDTVAALKFFEKMSNIQNDSLLKLCNDNIGLIENDYNKSKFLKESSEAERFRMLLIFVLIGVVIILATVYICYRHKKHKVFLISKQQEEYIRQLVGSIRAQQMSLKELEQRVDEKSKQSDKALLGIQELFAERFEIVNLMCQDYYEKKDASNLVKASLIKDIEKTLQKIGSKDSLSKIEQVLDSYFDGIASKLYDTLPDLRPQDRALLLLTLANLSAKTICIVCQLKDNIYYYNRRRKLKEKILSSSSQYKDEVLRMLATR